MAGDGKEITNPNLDLNDFIGLSFATFTDGKLYQLPTQQFANLYWFRYDWSSARTQDRIQETNSATSSVFPVNWSAYEDIADFFTNTVKEIDGQRVYGHMDYGKKIHRSAGASPTRGYQWLAMATRAYRTENRSMSGASARRMVFRGVLR